MTLDFSPEERAFRAEVRAFVAAAYPAALRDKQAARVVLAKDDILSWHRILAQKGWAAPGWAPEDGGPGWTPIQRFIFTEELALAGTVPIPPFGIAMLAPVLQAFGTPAQKARFLPPTLSGAIWWCQGFSEPGAGSDLAALSTRAIRDGDHYVVDGQKTWMTLAQHADWGFFLVRTDPSKTKQAGISFLLIDMTTPGVSVRPIITLDGGHEINEVWLDGVRVPVENRVFAENEGWTCAKYLLAYERTGIAGVARSKRALALLRQTTAGGLAADPIFRRKMTALEVDLLALEYTELRMLTRQADGTREGPDASLLKICGTEIQQRLTELALEAAGPEGATRRNGAADVYFNMRKASIYGGSNEIQRTLIAKALLGP